MEFLNKLKGMFSKNNEADNDSELSNVDGTEKKSFWTNAKEKMVSLKDKCMGMFKSEAVSVDEFEDEKCDCSDDCCKNDSVVEEEVVIKEVAAEEKAPKSKSTKKESN